MQPLRLAGLLGLTVAVAFYGDPVVGGEAVPTSVKSLDAHIHTVVAGGYWSKGDAEGFFRAVVAADGVHQVSHKLYLQWVKIDPDKGSYAVAASIGIRQVNADHAGGDLIDLTRDDSELGTFQMLVVVKREGAKEDLRFRLSANETFGTYTIREIR